MTSALSSAAANTLILVFFSPSAMHKVCIVSRAASRRSSSRSFSLSLAAQSVAKP